MGGLNVKNTIVSSVLSIIAPDLCISCGEIGTLLCEYCKNDISNDPYIGCVACELPTASGICTSHREVYSRAWIVGPREATLKKLIDTYKFSRAVHVAPILADLLDLRLPQLPQKTRVIALPSRASQIRARGYDHTARIAHLFASRRKLRIETPLVTTGSHAQHRLHTRKQRAIHAHNSFRAIKTLDPQTPYLLIDDIVTTGATLHEASQELIRAGARHVWVAAIARQPLD